MAFWCWIILSGRAIVHPPTHWRNLKWKWKSLSHVQLFATPWTVHGTLQARILEWEPFPSPGDLPNPGIEPRSPALQADSLAELWGKPVCVYSVLKSDSSLGTFIIIALPVELLRPLSEVHAYWLAQPSCWRCPLLWYTAVHTGQDPAVGVTHWQPPWGQNIPLVGPQFTWWALKDSFPLSPFP